MLKLLNKVSERDPLFFQKVGLVVGSALGIALGLIISERADRFEAVKEIEDGLPTSDEA